MNVITLGGLQGEKGGRGDPGPMGLPVSTTFLVVSFDLEFETNSYHQHNLIFTKI